jgi:hypothetical protein
MMKILVWVTETKMRTLHPKEHSPLPFISCAHWEVAVWEMGDDNIRHDAGTVMLLLVVGVMMMYDGHTW